MIYIYDSQLQVGASKLFNATAVFKIDFFKKVPEWL